ncbi:MAG TPA: stage II sporulation protein M [Bacteroidia bacterium]|nr:stage II sporulation protein M [Bacteroidia bacterium]
MREITFLKEQASKWQDFEKLLNEKNANPQKLAGLFIEVTDDLSYARTHYPTSKTTQYLNGLAARVHQEIYKNKKESRGRFFTFWKTEVPLIMFKYRKQLLLSFSIFAIFTLLGFISEIYDENFVRFVLGDGYVDATIERIRKGNPLGIYGEDEQTGMFLRITINNIFVSFIVFVMGLLFSFGTAYQLFRNGVMLGAFQGFFWKYNLFAKSLLVVWIHGTFEISAIIIAGAAGFVLGNSLLYPGTYKRIESLKIGARNSLKIIIGIVPVFIVAGFLESFVTRYTNMPLWLSLFIILGSLTCVVGYFIVYPLYVSKKMSTKIIDDGKN